MVMHLVMEGRSCCGIRGHILAGNGFYKGLEVVCVEIDLCTIL